MNQADLKTALDGVSAQLGSFAHSVIGKPPQPRTRGPLSDEQLRAWRGSPVLTWDERVRRKRKVTT